MGERSIGPWAYALCAAIWVLAASPAAAAPASAEPLCDWLSGIGLAAQAQGPDFPYRFRVTNLSDINAFALPGGKICITRGLLSRLGAGLSSSSFADLAIPGAAR